MIRVTRETITIHGGGVKGRCQSLVCLTRAIVAGGSRGQFLRNLGSCRLSLRRYQVLKKCHSKEIFIKMRACGSDSHPARQHLAPISPGQQRTMGALPQNAVWASACSRDRPRGRSPNRPAGRWRRGGARGQGRGINFKFVLMKNQ